MEEEGCERLVPMRKTTHEAPSLLCRPPQDHMKISLDLKGFVRGLDPPMLTFRLPAEQQPDVMPCILSLPRKPCYQPRQFALVSALRVEC